MNMNLFVQNPDYHFMKHPLFEPLPDYQCTEFKPHADRIEVFHGWQDEVVPPENVWRFCQQHRASLHMLDADHRLLTILPIMADAFDRFLSDCTY